MLLKKSAFFTQKFKLTMLNTIDKKQEKLSLFKPCFLTRKLQLNLVRLSIKFLGRGYFFNESNL